ncbi:pentapeptide repeat-containing protein [Devosia sp. SD17-2]|uniref:pentapeptide repeat-containing protein n=1 Tax=Devosia sp. SD17-2 TaxID=2976459 RepID=UPI0023D86872|nr:pentapeptide repeat-containing protein [Devosia sp. SD17-2]WEJ33379.1 pentapeptide repeat-containing protein [Devosia sp. SD17-2]
MSQLHVSGSNNNCNLHASGVGNTITIQCPGIDPAVIEKLSERILQLGLDNQQLQKAADEWANKYRQLRGSLQSTTSTDPAIAYAWDALSSGDLGTAEALIGTLDDLRVSLKRIDDTTSLNLAMNTIREVSELSDGSVRGQNQAIRLWIDNGNNLDGSDLSGVSFEGGDLSGLRARSALMHAINLSNANLTDADLTSSYLRYATLSAATLTRLQGSDINAALVVATASVWEGADLANSTWLLADFSGANFRNANLKGAVLAFSDLSGADFTGADLSGAYLTGAILTGAIFNDAILNQVNAYGAVAETPVFSDEQVPYLCKHEINTREMKDGDPLRIRIEIVERWESDRYSSGYEFGDSTFLADYAFLPSFLEIEQKNLPKCTTRVQTQSGC